MDGVGASLPSLQAPQSCTLGSCCRPCTAQRPARRLLLLQHEPPPLSFSTMGTKPQKIPFLTLSSLLPPHPTPILPPLPQLFSSTLHPPPTGVSEFLGEPQEGGMPKATRKGGQVAPAELQQI